MAPAPDQSVQIARCQASRRTQRAQKPRWLCFAAITTLVLNLDNGSESHSHRTQFMFRLVQFRGLGRGPISHMDQAASLRKAAWSVYG